MFEVFLVLGCWGLVLLIPGASNRSFGFTLARMLQSFDAVLWKRPEQPDRRSNQTLYPALFGLSGKGLEPELSDYGTIRRGDKRQALIGSRTATSRVPNVQKQFRGTATNGNGGGLFRILNSEFRIQNSSRITSAGPLHTPFPETVAAYKSAPAG
jgi:hypothetical protein